VTASIGMAFTADPTTRPDALIARADTAMYAAKRAGPGGVCSYDDSLTSAGRGVPVLLNELRGAIARGELSIVYQPIIRLADGALTGAEALVRWDHPVRGRLSPDLFIALAERHGLIGKIDAYVLERACQQLHDWELADSRWRRRTIAVNLSGRGLLDPGLSERVLGTLRRCDLAPERLCLEITETALIGEMDCARRVIASLSERGVRIALDDFGTGYSTLAHLQQLEADIIKIDRSFVTRLGGRPRDRQIVAAVTAMAHALGMSVVGEGVESIVERDALTVMSCDEAQGNLFARPCEAAEIAALARTGTGVAFPLAA
jgi:EAL domain-containing protein (putative c-di-GMP-specific phosphodiesterase class I)